MKIPGFSRTTDVLVKVESQRYVCTPVLAKVEWNGETPVMVPDKINTHLYRRRTQSKYLVPSSLCVSIHVDKNVNSILVNNIGCLSIARHLCQVRQSTSQHDNKGCFKLPTSATESTTTNTWQVTILKNTGSYYFCSGLVSGLSVALFRRVSLTVFGILIAWAIWGGRTSLCSSLSWVQTAPSTHSLLHTSKFHQLSQMLVCE